MIPIERLVVKTRTKLNKLASEVHQSIPVENIILVLNEAQIRLIKKKVNVNNIYQLGFDAFKSRYEDLQNLVENTTILNFKDAKVAFKAYETDLPSGYFLPSDIVLEASKGNCLYRKINVPRITKHDDVSVLMNNTNFQPSFRWQETMATISGDKLIIYVNDPEGDFTIDKVFFTYLRLPQNVDIEGYEHLDGTPSVNRDCELPDHLEDELLALAVMELGTNIENPVAVTGQQNITNYTE